VASGTDAAAAIKLKRGLSKSRHHRRRSSSSSCSSSPEMCRRHRINLREFNGETSPEDFWADYLNCSENSGWTDKEKVAHLKNALVGKAKKYFGTLVVKATPLIR